MARKNQKWVIDRYTKKLRKVQEVDNYQDRAHYVMPDIGDYQSPVTLKNIHGRTQRREDLLATGCREIDPSEKRQFMAPHSVSDIEVDTEALVHHHERLEKMSDEQVYNERQNRRG